MKTFLNKKYLVRLSFVVLSFLTILLPKLSFASNATEGSSNTTSGIQNPLKVGSIPDFVALLLGYVVKIGAVVAVFAFIYSGFLFVQARGNSEKLKGAKDVFLNTVIGVAVLLGAQLIASIIVGTINNIKG